jgi:uncharacterized iron-regulated membrane protein
MGRGRKLWLEVHLWLGLVTGLPICIIALTGSILVFNHELEHWLDSGFRRVEAPAPGVPRLSIAALFDRARANLPADRTLSIFTPRGQQDDSAVIARYAHPRDPAGEQPPRFELSLDPYSGAVRAVRPVSNDIWPITRRNAMRFVYRLHDSFVAGLGGRGAERTGRIVAGVVALVLLVSSITGLVIWWPRGGKWKQALTIKRGASGHRFNVDLHRVCGIYSLVVLVVLAYSGAYFVFPKTMLSPVAAVEPQTPRERPPALRSGPADGRPPLGAVRAAALAQPAAPGMELEGMQLQGPSAGEAVYGIYFREAGDDIVRAFRTVVIDQYSGRVLHVRAVEPNSASDVVARWQFPLHSGQAFGWPGRIAVLIAGLIIPALYVTGIVIWWNKRVGKKTKTARRRRAAVPVAAE